MRATAEVDHKEKLPYDYSPTAEDCWRHRREYFSSPSTLIRHARFWHSRSVDSGSITVKHHYAPPNRLAAPCHETFVISSRYLAMDVL